MHRIGNQRKWLVDSIGPIMRRSVERRSVGGSRPPRIPLPIDEREPGVRDVETSIFVNRGNVRGGGDVESFATSNGAVFNIDGAGNDRHDGLRGATACLPVAPLSAGLISPAAPGLGEIVALVFGIVVLGEAGILVCGMATGDSLIGEADEVEHAGD